MVPSPTPSHMLASGELFVRFREIVGNRRRVLQEVDVRMADGNRYRTADVLVLHEWQDSRPLDPGNVVLVCEVVSPSGGDERGEKMTAYAEAGIEWICSPSSPRMRRFARPSTWVFVLSAELTAPAPSAQRCQSRLTAQGWLVTG